MSRILKDVLGLAWFIAIWAAVAGAANGLEWLWVHGLDQVAWAAAVAGLMALSGLGAVAPFLLAWWFAVVLLDRLGERR